MKRNQGLSLLELVVTSSVLAVVIYAAFSTTRLAVDAADQAMTSRQIAQQRSNTNERSLRQLASASLNSLQAVPTGNNFLPEPMQQGNDYDNLQFRKVVSYSNQSPVYEPPLGQVAYRMFLQKADDNSPIGDLMLEENQNLHTLATNVANLSFRLDRKTLTMTYETSKGYETPVLVTNTYLIRAR